VWGLRCSLTAQNRSTPLGGNVLGRWGPCSPTSPPDATAAAALQADRGFESLRAAHLKDGGVHAHNPCAGGGVHRPGTPGIRWYSTGSLEVEMVPLIHAAPPLQTA